MITRRRRSGFHMLKKNRVRRCTVACCVLASLSMSRGVVAAVVNGGFESGTFAGFTTVGNTTIQPGPNFSGVSPTEGSFEALISNNDFQPAGGGSPVAAAQLDTFL